METAAAETHENEDLGANSFLLSFWTAQVPEEPSRSRLCCMRLHGWTAKKKVINCVTELEKRFS